jgi:hypothetical protein
MIRSRSKLARLFVALALVLFVASVKSAFADPASPVATAFFAQDTQDQDKDKDQPDAADIDGKDVDNIENEAVDNVDNRDVENVDDEDVENVDDKAVNDGAFHDTQTEDKDRVEDQVDDNTQDVPPAA